MFSIGEFSRITGLSVKTLRFYHDKRIVVPSRVDSGSGYRYYDDDCVDRARVVVRLRAMKFSIEEIGSMLERQDDEASILEHLERRLEAVDAEIREQRHIALSLKRIIESEREADRAMTQSSFEVEEKRLDTLLIAGVRMKGRYEECGKGFAKIGKSLGRHICGKPLCLYYDGEYREDDADFEACMPLRKKAAADGISVRELPGGRCVALVHKGPYDELGRSYEKILTYIKAKGYEGKLPSREVYLKGPGMIFKGNPKNYLTEIQVPIEDTRG